MTKPAPVITEIIKRVDSLAEARPDLSRTKLSKRLFGSGHALEHIADGSRSPTVRVLQRAMDELDALEKGRAA